MPFEVRLPDGAVPAGGIVADRRLYLAADKATVVEDGDPRAAFLLCGVGGEIPAKEAERLGLSVQDGRVALKAQAPAPNKARKAREDK